MKKWMAVFLAAAAITGLSGCAGKGAERGQSGGQKSGGQVKLSMWVHVADNTLEGKSYKMRADAFNKANEGKCSVQVEFISRGGGGTGYEDKINAALTTNSLPDILTLDGPNTSAYADSGILVDLTNKIPQDSKNDFLDTALKQGTYQEKLYSLAIQESTCLIYYNKDMFVKAGLCKSVDSAEQDLGFSVEHPWTFSQFTDICAKLTAYYKKPAIDLHLGSHDEWITYALAPFIWTSGGDLISKDGLKADGIFNSDASKKGFSFLQSMITNKYTTTTPVDNGFEMGTYPMTLNGAWEIPILNLTYQKQIPNWGALPYPVGDSGKLYAPTGSWAFGVAKTTKHLDEAAALADWMTNKDSSILITTATGLLPAKKSAYDSVSTYNAGANKVLKDQLVAAGHPRPSSVAYPEITFSFQQAVDRILNGNDVSQSINQGTAQLEVKLKSHTKK